MKLLLITALALGLSTAFAQNHDENKPGHDKEHQHVKGAGADHGHDEAHHKPHDHKAHHPDHDNKAGSGHDKEHQHVQAGVDHEHDEAHHKDHDHKAHHPEHKDEQKKKK